MNKKSIVLSIVAVASGSFLLNLAIAGIILPGKLSSPSEPQGLKQKQFESRAINDLPSVPKDTCGDPYDPSASAWYPVFLDGANVDAIRSNLCQDATKLIRKDTGKLSVQVASFTSREKALAYAKFVNGSVGEPIIVAKVASESAPAIVSSNTSQKLRKWYEGGTLHRASALEWQKSDYANKLATCADFVSAMRQKKLLKPSIQNQIQSMDDLRPFAQQLVDNLDAATKKETDPQENTKMYANQTVSDIALMLVILLEWAE